METDEKILRMQIEVLGHGKGVQVYEKTRKDFIICQGMRSSKEILRERNEILNHQRDSDYNGGQQKNQ